MKCRIFLRENVSLFVFGITLFIVVLSIAFPHFLTELFNKCLALHHFTALWKAAKLKLLNKPGRDPSSPKSYRPISLLPTLGKLFDKIISIKLVSELEASHIFHINQFAYLKGRSAELAAFTALQKIKYLKSQYGSTLVISLDIANAFNSLRWKPLLEHLIRLFYS